MEQIWWLQGAKGEADEGLAGGGGEGGGGGGVVEEEFGLGMHLICPSSNRQRETKSRWRGISGWERWRNSWLFEVISCGWIRPCADKLHVAGAAIGGTFEPPTLGGAWVNTSASGRTNPRDHISLDAELHSVGYLFCAE
jgi:hypothetical protein